MRWLQVLLVLAGAILDATHAFVPTTVFREAKYTLQSYVNGESESNGGIKLQKEDSRAGKEGYSVLRQPLHRQNWDPTLDPKFKAPETLNEGDEQRQDIAWWSNKNDNKKSRGSIRSYNSKPVVTRMEEEHTADNPQPGDDDSLDLFQRSIDTLDYPFVLNALRDECFTLPAKQIIYEAIHAFSIKSSDDKKNQKLPPFKAYQPLTAETHDGVQERYMAVQEMQWLLSDEVDLGEAYFKNRRGYKCSLGNGNPPPLEGLSFDLAIILQVVDQGQILEGPDILEISTMLNAMEDIQLWSQALERVETDKKFVQLPSIINDIQLNTTLQDLLTDAFDKDGILSGKTFPILGRLRAKVRSLKADILQTLDTLVNMPSIKGKLALESGGPLISEVANGGRLVLPIDPKYASSIGIVHDSSRSGKTVYVEPSEVVGPTNELRQTEAELKAEEARVWRSLTEQVLNNRKDLERSVRAVGQLDLVLARCLLGRKLKGIIPVVKDEGVISLMDAKHPVLLLRQIADVVGSDITLGADGNQGLVLTGPNAGGKTIILKLIGLLALMARSGIPVPAEPPKAGSDFQPRVDFFDPILADIGDMQSVGGDLSTFSGHMLVCREVLANSGKNALVLMDELGSGTDPAQGVAIAQALLEALVDTGCRVAITTHYMELKQLAAADPRFAVAGMQFVKGRPTYKLLPGTVGESYAMSVAERLGLPQAVIDRATALLDSETRQMGDLIRELEDQKSVVEDQIAELEVKKDEMAVLEEQMKEEQVKLERKMLVARRDEAKKFAIKLEEKEEVLENILNKLKSDPSRKILAKSWDDIKFVKRDALNEAENVPSVIAAKRKAAKTMEDIEAELIPLAEMREKPNIQPGDKLIMCKPGPLFGREAIVVKNLGRQLEVQVSGMPIGVKLTEVSMFIANVPQAPRRNTIEPGDTKRKLSRAAERALMNESHAPTPRRKATPADSAKPAGASLNMRTEGNTVDVRGLNLSEASDKAKEKFSQCLMTNRSVVFVLHGHGTSGILKTKVRQWLGSERKLVKRFAPASSEDGGDAFTVVELR